MRRRCRKILEEELARREFFPVILRILSATTKEPSEWEVTTDRGPSTFQINNEDDVRRVDLHSASVLDSHGVRYLIPDIRRLDAGSRRNLRSFFMNRGPPVCLAAKNAPGGQTFLLVCRNWREIFTSPGATGANAHPPGEKINAGDPGGNFPLRRQIGCYLASLDGVAGAGVVAPLSAVPPLVAGALGAGFGSSQPITKNTLTSTKPASSRFIARSPEIEGEFLTLYVRAGS